MRGQGKALAASLVPGGGQLYVGQYAQAMARFVIVALCLFAAATYPSAGALGVTRTLLFGAAIGVWLSSVWDARVVALGSPEVMVLRGRRLLWVMGSVLALLVASVIVAMAASYIRSGRG